MVHNVSVAGDHVYIADNQTPVVPVFRVSQPDTPSYVRHIDTTPYGSGARITDVTALGGRLYCSEKPQTGAGYVHIFDITDVDAAAPHVKSFPTGISTHSCWPTADGNHLVVARETYASPENQVEIWDISDIQNPICAGMIHMGLPASTPACGVEVQVSGDSPCPRSPVVDGDLLYVSWYAAGVIVFDISDPANPVELARDDTHSLPPSLGKGCWGVYPFLGPDRILASDTDFGLHVYSHRTTQAVTVALPPPGTPGDVVEGVDFTMAPHN